MPLTFHVADSLTGRLIGRINPTEWIWADPLTGKADGKFTVTIPTEADGPDWRERTFDLVNLTRPHIRQICARDELGRWWFGGPIVSEPERTDDGRIVISSADWRAWFYVAPIRPVGNTRVEYLHLQANNPPNQVEQNKAIADLATLGLATVGPPRLVVDTPTSSGVMRDVTARMFTYTGTAMDNVAQRYNGPDWWTYIASDPADARNVVAHLAVAWPERSLQGAPITFRREVMFRSQEGVGGNLLTHTWPQGTPPPSRVIGVGSEPPPDEMWGVAEDPDLLNGERLAWDEIWSLPEGTTTADTAYAHSLARLLALGSDMGVIAVTVKVDATDLGSWGPGDRSRLVINDGWRDIDLPTTRIISRTLEGRGPAVTKVSVSIDLSAEENEYIAPQEES